MCLIWFHQFSNQCLRSLVVTMSLDAASLPSQRTVFEGLRCVANQTMEEYGLILYSNCICYEETILFLTLSRICISYFLLFSFLCEVCVVAYGSCNYKVNNNASLPLGTIILVWHWKALAICLTWKSPQSRFFLWCYEFLLFEIQTQWP